MFEFVPTNKLLPNIQKKAAIAIEHAMIAKIPFMTLLEIFI